MKKQLPILIGLLCGAFAFIEFYIPHDSVAGIQRHLLDFALVLTAAAYVLGGVNVLQVNVPKVRRRERDWQFKVVLIAGAVIMGLAGTKFWYSFTGGEPSPKATIQMTQRAASSPEVATVIIDTEEPDALVKVGGAPEQPAHPSRAHRPVTIDVPPGKTSIKLWMRAAGYTEVTGEVELKPGQTVVVKGTPKMMWGKEGRVFTWLYNYVFAPCNSTMFALLAFFVASAAFRAFRARNIEAGLLLGSAILILLARAPFGRGIHPWLPEFADWILDIPNNAGRRAIMMGAAIGAIATGLRIILGLERSHLGSD
jgi:hypothetical protein